MKVLTRSVITMLVTHCLTTLCLLTLCLTTLSLTTPPAQAESATAKSIKLFHYQADPRYEFGHKVLELALKSLGFEVELLPIENAASINEARGSQMLKLDQGVDYQFLSLNAERAQDFIAIDEFPIYQGLLGTRLFLVKKGNRDLFKHVKTVADLRKFRAVHGTHWSDLAVYHANDLPVETDASYEGLFRQLTLGRGDYFSRGINEIWGELDRHKDEVEIADHVALFYLHPCVFLLNKKSVGLANLIKKGLRKSKRDGSQDRLFLDYFSDKIKKSQLDQRALIILKNPSNQGSPISSIDTSLWMPGDQAKAIQQTPLF